MTRRTKPSAAAEGPTRKKGGGRESGVNPRFRAAAYTCTCGRAFETFELWDAHSCSLGQVPSAAANPAAPTAGVNVIDFYRRPLLERIRALEAELYQMQIRAEAAEHRESKEYARTERAEARAAELEKVAGHCTCEDCMNYDAREREED